MFELVSAVEKQVSLGSQLHPLLTTGLLVAVVVLSVLLGRAIAHSLRSEVHAQRLGVMFSVMSVGVLAIVLAWPPRFGVDLRGGITIIGQLREDADKSNAVNVKDMIPQLLARIDPAGLSEINIRPLGTDKIEVVIPDVGMDEAMRIWGRLTQAGELRFRIVADTNYHGNLTNRGADLIARGINDIIVRDRGEQPNDNQSGSIIGRWYELGRVAQSEARQGIVPFKFMPSTTHLVRNSKSKQLIDVSQFRGSSQDFAAWCDKEQIRRVEVLCVEPPTPDDKYNVEGQHIANASSGFDDRGRPAVLFQTTREGRNRMYSLTSANQSDGTRIPLMAIISDGKLITAPSINSAISTNGIIEGTFSKAEVEDLVINLKAGKLEVTLSQNPISVDYQQSNIGEELKRNGVQACIVSLVLIAICMCVYYRLGGFVATFVLFLNLILVMAIVLTFHIPISLTGLAGIVLTIGMAVDANVLIFERVREELKKGAALRMALRNGYDRAWTTIFDSNVTTLITAAVLYVIGTEQLKGFSVMLGLGIATSMFTAIYCSRVILELAERKKWITEMRFLNIYGGGVIDFVGRRRVWYAVSFAAILIGVCGSLFRGTEIFDHDLRGGSTARMVLAENTGLDVVEIRNKLNQYQDKINERETVRFSVAAIDSTDFKDRVFKVDSNIPIWEGDGPPPYKPIDQALVEVFGNQLMQLHVDYDPNKVQVTRMDTQSIPPSDTVPTGQSPTGMQPTQPPQPGPDAAGLPLSIAVINANPLSHILVQDNAPAEVKPQDPTQNSTGVANDPAQQPPPSPPGDDPAAAPAQEQPMLSATGRFLATAELNFAQPISRKNLIDTIVTAAAKTNQVTLDPADVTVNADGKDAEDLSVQADTWAVAINIGREADAKLVLDALQAEYNGKPYFPTLSGVGGQIAAQTQWRALAAILSSLIGIVLYVWVRFQNVGFGLGAVVALAHDVIITVGAVALSYWLAPFLGFLQVENFRISLALIAGLLTLIGYSINDTIVVFDRIREVRGKRSELTAEMVNVAVSQTLGRTILTSTLTLIAVLVLYFMGGESVHGFAFSLVVGIVVGTYSSIFIASPIALWLISRAMKAKAASRVGG